MKEVLLLGAHLIHVALFLFMVLEVMSIDETVKHNKKRKISMAGFLKCLYKSTIGRDTAK